MPIRCKIQLTNCSREIVTFHKRSSLSHKIKFVFSSHVSPVLKLHSDMSVRYCKSSLPPTNEIRFRLLENISVYLFFFLFGLYFSVRLNLRCLRILNIGHGFGKIGNLIVDIGKRK